MPFYTKYGSIAFSKAISRALIQLGCLEKEKESGNNFIDVLMNMVENQDTRLFNALRMAVKDIEEITLVILAEDTVYFVDQDDGKMNFWNESHWFNKDEWREALQVVTKSKYASKTMQRDVGNLLGLSGFVYLVSCEEGYFKIGYSKDPHGRMTQFSVIPPFDFQLEHTLRTDDCRAAELKLHERFSDKRANGEWFKLSKDEVKLIKSITEYKHGAFYDADGQKIMLDKSDEGRSDQLSIIRLLQKMMGGNKHA